MVPLTVGTSMGFRFRRSIGLGRFLRVNVGKQSGSLSVGIPGAHLNLGPRGVRSSLGIPGTGISYGSKVGSQATGSASAGPGCAKIGCFGALGLSALGVVASAAAQNGSPGAMLFALVMIGLMVWGAISLLKWRDRKKLEKQMAVEKAKLAELEAQLEEYRSQLRSRFGPEIAAKIEAGELWQGCPVEIMIEILGQPSAVDESVLRDKVKRTYKYDPLGANRYALRVIVENGEVIGWEKNAG